MHHLHSHLPCSWNWRHLLPSMMIAPNKPAANGSVPTAVAWPSGKMANYLILLPQHFGDSSKMLLGIWQQRTDLSLSCPVELTGSPVSNGAECLSWWWGRGQAGQITVLQSFVLRPSTGDCANMHVPEMWPPWWWVGDLNQAPPLLCTSIFLSINGWWTGCSENGFQKRAL